MNRIDIKPLSVNEVWKGKRYKTDSYKTYERAMLYLLPQMNTPKDNLKVNICFGFSSSGSDIDNCLKPFLDCLQKKYAINDNRIYELNVKKEIVSKGNEFIKFSIESIIV
jgi:Holliday junction resolvase RusA-like endonuclease